MPISDCSGPSFAQPSHVRVRSRTDVIADFMVHAIVLYPPGRREAELAGSGDLRGQQQRAGLARLGWVVTAVR